MRFELGDSPETSPFFVSAYALNGCWLALGEASGALSLWDLRSGRRQWRKVAQGSDGTRRRWSIDEIHLDVLAGVIASSDLESGIVTVHKVADGELVSVVMHYPYVRILDPSDDYVAAAAANIAATAERAERHQAGEGFAEESHTELSDAGKATTPNLEGRLVRARLCSGERVGDASLPLCLLSLTRSGGCSSSRKTSATWSGMVDTRAGHTREPSSSSMWCGCSLATRPPPCAQAGRRAQRQQ